MWFTIAGIPSRQEELAGGARVVMACGGHRGFPMFGWFLGFGRAVRHVAGAGVLALAWAGPVLAQSGTQRAADDEATAPLAGPRYDEVVITGAPLPRSIEELSQPISVVEGRELMLQQDAQLGEVLATQPGISQTYFGPGSSRPVIRGLGADNIRVLENGLGLLDASSVSPDHAVSLDPMLTKRIEVVRGPAALLYGPTAIGGVVNALTNRIPDEAIDAPARGSIEGRGDSVSAGGAGVAFLEGGYKGFSYHLDGFYRNGSDIRIPGYARSRQLRAVDPPRRFRFEAKDTLPDSDVEARGGSVGLSYAGHWGYVGFAPSIYETTYGVVGHGAGNVHIDLNQRRFDVAGALNAPVPYFTNIKARLGLVDYKHIEFEGDTVGTVFTNRGYDLRVDGLHERIGILEGAIGFESYYSDFEAEGSEAFVPPSKTSVQSLFAFEEADFDPLRLQAAGRLDYSRVEVDAHRDIAAADARDFVTGGASLGAIYSIAEDYSAALSLAYTQRAPNAAELFAHGVHVATSQYEIGNRDLAIQESLGLDFALRKSLGRVSGSIGGFYNRFNNYLGLVPTGARDGESGEPVFEFRSIPAEFIGMEAEATITLFDHEPHRLDLLLQADYVEASNRKSGEALPLIPPFRFRTGLAYQVGALAADLSVLWARQQDRNPQEQLPTDGYTMLNASATYRVPVGPVTADLFLRGFNLLDEEARVAASPLKDVAPLPGVGVVGGLRLSL